MFLRGGLHTLPSYYPLVSLHLVAQQLTFVMAGLLSIPQELRDRILELALSAIDSPPHNPASAVDYVPLNDTDYQSWLDAKQVRYPKNPVTPHALPLLLLNRRLHADTLAALTRLCLPFELDAMLVRNGQIWATWLSVGPFAPKLDRVHIPIRLFPRSTPVQESANADSASNVGGFSGIFWQLSSLIERLLLCGPVGARQGIKKGFIGVDILELDILTSSGTPEKGQNVDEMRDSQGPEGESQPAVRAEEWLIPISRGIRVLLEMYEDIASKGQLFYERVGKIRIMLDGEVRTELDLAKCLAGLQYSELVDSSYPNCAPRWWDTMKKIRQTREQAGLPVLPFTESQEF
jgi:hypothetical protein